MDLWYSVICFNVDINECDTDNGGCNQTCTNTHGSFQCSCEEGFTLAADKLDCDGEFDLSTVAIMVDFCDILQM